MSVKIKIGQEREPMVNWNRNPFLSVKKNDQREEIHFVLDGVKFLEVHL